MDEANNSAQTIRFNIPPKKTADVTIDLRQNSLVHLFTVNNIENTRHVNSSKCTKTEQFFSQPPSNMNNYEETSCSSDAKDEDKNFCSLQNPSTIIHVKIIPSTSTNGSKLIEDSIQSSSSDFVCDRKCSPSVSHKSEDSILNKNCLKVRTTLHEMQKEMKNLEGEKHSDERTSILKEFEISKQLERLRSENKKISRRKYHTFIDRSSSSARIHSPKSEFSEVSSNEISSIFNDADDLKMIEDVIAKPVEAFEVAITGEKLVEPVNGGKVVVTRNIVNVPREISMASPLCRKRKNTSALGPRSKKKKMFKVTSRSELSQLSNRKQVIFTCPSHQFYFNGVHIFKDCNGHFIKEDICLFINDMHSDEDYAQIGCEMLTLWKLNAYDIEELKQQVKEEFKHKQEEHIMPLILGLSSDQIESTYEDVKGEMKFYDITEQDSDEDLISNVEEEEDDDDDGEFKSLDTLYKEEFSKQCYKELFDSSDFQPWKVQEEQNDVKTDYSRSRPKRSTVDYSPSAYAFISFMEGRRASYRSSYDVQQNAPDSFSKVKNTTKVSLNKEKTSNGKRFNLTSRHGKLSGSKSSDDAAETSGSYEETGYNETWFDGILKHSEQTIDACTLAEHPSMINDKDSLNSKNNEKSAKNKNSEELDSSNQTERSERKANCSKDDADQNELNICEGEDVNKISFIFHDSERKKTNLISNVHARPNSAPPNIGIGKEALSSDILQSVFYNKVDETLNIISLKS